MSLRQYFYDKVWKLDEQVKSKVVLPDPSTTGVITSSTNRAESLVEGLSAQQLRKIALKEPLIMKAIKKKSMDTFRNWFEIKPLDSDGKLSQRAKDLINDFDKRTNIKSKFNVAGIASYIYGTSFIERTFLESDRNKSYTKPPKNVKPLNLVLLNSENIQKMDKMKDGGSQLYYVYKEQGKDDVYIHPDRLLVVAIDRLPYSNFGNSVINSASNILKSKMNSDLTSGEILNWFGRGIITMMIRDMNDEQKKKALEYFKSHPDFYVFDQDYQMDVKNPTRIDPRPFYDYFYVNIAAALVIPQHILTGVEMGNVTGSEVAVSDYYHDVENIQQMIFTPLLEKVYKNLFESNGIKWKYYIDWNPIFVDELSEAKILQTRTYSAKEAKIAGIIDVPEARKILNDGVVSLDVFKELKIKKDVVPPTSDPNIQPQPAMKQPTIRQSVDPLNVVQREMIIKARELGEKELVEQEKRLEEAKERFKNENKKQSRSRTKKLA